MARILREPDKLQSEPCSPRDPRTLLVPGEEPLTSARLGLYANGYPARIRESLEETFPALARLLGNEGLEELTHRYIRKVRLRLYNLNDAGALLPRFLQTDPLIVQFPFAADLAQLEWRLARAFHARQLPPLERSRVARFSAQQWARAVFRFQPSVAVVASDWPIRQVWSSTGKGESVWIPKQKRQSFTLVRRVGFGVVCDSISRPQASLLSLLLERHPLEEAFLLCPHRLEPEAVSRWFARWMSDGLFTRFVRILP